MSCPDRAAPFVLAWSICATAAALPACTLALVYPTDREERGQSACTNTVDDDLDGIVDCDDPSCDGECAENVAERCDDGRDQDGDGRTDIDDAQCWPFAPFAVRRCASVDGDRFEPVLTAESDDFTGDATFEPDDRTPGAWVMAALSGPAGLRSTVVTTGALEGTELTAAFRLSNRSSARLWLALGDARVLDDEAEAVSIVLGPGVVVHGQGIPFGLPTTSRLDDAAWHFVQVTLTRDPQGHLRVRVAIGDTLDDLTYLVPSIAVCDAAASQPICIPETWRPAEPLRFAWTGTPATTGGAVRVADVSLVRSAYAPPPPCPDAVVPQLRTERSADLLAAARGDGLLCALTAASDDAGARVPGIHAWRSTDDGAHWEVTMNADGGALEHAVAIAWDGSRFVGGAMRAIAGTEMIDRVLPLHSEDCRAFVVGDGDLLSSGPQGRSVIAARPTVDVLDYAIGAFGEDGAVQHELSVAISTRVVRAVSPSGLVSTFEGLLAGAGVSELPSAPDLTTTGRRAARHVTRIGRDRVALYGSGRDVHLLVDLDEDGWRELDATLLTPTGLPATFDTTEVRGGVLLPAALVAGSLPHATLLYTGDSEACPACSATGTAEVYFGTSTPPDAMGAAP